MKENITQKAKEFAELMHAGQKRKQGTPYITHPAGVVKILENILERCSDPTDKLTKRIISDPTDRLYKKYIFCSTGWLHDILEDTQITYRLLRKQFGKEIVDRVYLLSRNVNREEYKQRIKNSDMVVKIVKLADTLHNLQDLNRLPNITARIIESKIEDCKTFYIPLAMETCPAMA